MKKAVGIILLIAIMILFLNGVSCCSQIIDESPDKFEFVLFIQGGEPVQFTYITISMDNSNDVGLLKYRKGKYILSKQTGRFEQETTEEWKRKLNREKITQFINILNYVDFLSMPDSFENVKYSAWIEVLHKYTLTVTSKGKEIKKEVVATEMFYFPNFKNENSIKAFYFTNYLYDLVFFRSDDGTLLFWGDNK